MEQIKFQKIGERNAWRAVISGSLIAPVVSTAAPICALACERRAVGSHADAFRRAANAMHNGMPPAINIRRQSSPPSANRAVCTAMASSGVMSAPPTGTAALTTVMARARSPMNQLLATTVGAWTKPALKAERDDAEIDDQERSCSR